MSGSGKHYSFSEAGKISEAYEGVPSGFEDAGTAFIYDQPVDEDRSFCSVGPDYSARRTFTRKQAAILVLTVLGSLTFLFLHWEAAIITGSLIFSSFYLCVVLFRLGVLASFPQMRPIADLSGNHFNERYVILVALYKEAQQVGPLVAALDALRWPGGIKEIHLICECDDTSTIQAIRKLGRADIILHIVPEGRPQTKPRALNFALRRVSGNYLVLYDAEDRPHANQLLEAAHAFETGTETLACVQAPLSIDNRQESLIARFFAIEYETLFRGILPVLAKWRAPIPLGGTSNHFRLKLLKAVGGWDSFNVTEDADLGMRLARHNMTCETISLPTYEEAPATIRSWMRQRTRWIKGWLQTLLVHLRRPAQTAREMGWRRFLQFHMVLTSVVVSVIVHPLFLITFGFQMFGYWTGEADGSFGIWIAGISVFNLVCGYLSYGLLAWVVQDVRGSRADKAIIFLFPVYWLLISIAGWLAIGQLLLCPHYWSKTEHGSNRRKTPASSLPGNSSIRAKMF